MRVSTDLAAIAALTIILLVLAAAIVGWCHSRATIGSGEPRKRRLSHTQSPHIVVDTLNLAHWLWRKPGGMPIVISPSLITTTIERTAPALKRAYPGQVMYVLKDRDSQLNDDAARAAYQSAATDNGVYVYVAERYADPPARTVADSTEHSARGRDDFFIALLAQRWRCAVLTEDRLRDFDEFRGTIQSFHVYEFAFAREAPRREFINPSASAFMRLRKPRMVRFATLYPSITTQAEQSKLIETIFQRARRDGLLVAFISPRKSYDKAYMSAPTEIGWKPGSTSLWLSTPETDRISWYTWAINGMPEWVDLDKMAVVGYKVDREKLLRVSSHADLDAFHNKYNSAHQLKWLLIDWKTIADNYSGVAFDPYDRSWASSDRSQLWYTMLDSITYVIWDPAVVGDPVVLHEPANAIRI